jgi:hypothetical protein
MGGIVHMQHIFNVLIIFIVSPNSLADGCRLSAVGCRLSDVRCPLFAVSRLLIRIPQPVGTQIASRLEIDGDDI